MITRNAVGAAAPLWVRERLAGPVREATIVHAGAHAVYATTGTDCIAVLSREATAVPCGLRTSLDSLHALSPTGVLPAVGETVLFGQGLFAIADTDIRVGRLTDASVPYFEPSAAGALAESLRAALGSRLDDVRAELPAIALEQLAAADPSAVHALLGRGDGLTPLGDDVLAGWLATMAAARTQSPLATLIDDVAAARTTTLSAALLHHAAAGDVLPPFSELIGGLTAGDDQLGDQLNTLLAIGHTSGAGLALGLLIALDHLSSRSHRP